MPKTTDRKAQGRALTIGVDSLKRGNPRYLGFGRLTVAEADATDIADIAKTTGFTVKTLLGAGATREAVKAEILAAARALRSRDILLLSFSGHGDRTPDTNHDEEDRQDEAWCLYDDEIIDDELYKLWAKFKRGVRILVLSDSCYSGTILINLLLNRRRRRKSRRKKVKASVLLISACQDNEEAFEDGANSIFIGALKRVWDQGRFRGTYKALWDRISREMPEGRGRQTPNYSKVGARNRTFERQHAFTI